MRVELRSFAPLPHSAPLRISVDAGWQDGQLHLRYTVDGLLAAWQIPLAGSGERRDGLWKSTCFEAFAASAEAEGYSEFNFAPSGDWAAYSFNAYRAGMTPLALELPPLLHVQRHPDKYVLSAEVLLPEPPSRLSLCAVLVREDGQLTYWAARHPATAPDFHNLQDPLLEFKAR